MRVVNRLMNLSTFDIILDKIRESGLIKYEEGVK